MAEQSAFLHIYIVLLSKFCRMLMKLLELSKKPPEE